MVFSSMIAVMLFAVTSLSAVRGFVHPAAFLPNICTGRDVSSKCPHDVPGTRKATAIGQLNAFSLGSLTESIKDVFHRERDTETSLPQDPKADKAARLKQLEEKRIDYRWSTAGIPVGTPFLEGFPPSEELPKVPWITGLVANLLRIYAGTLRGTIGASEIIEALTSPERAKNFAVRLRDHIRDGGINDWAVDINDFEDLHAFPVKTPPSVFDYELDDGYTLLYSRQWESGPNCVVLKKCSEATRKKLKVLDTDPAYKSLKDKVDSLLKDGKLFVVDHELLAGMPAAPIEDVPRYLAAGIALFEVVDDDLLPLKPIGIQVSQGEEATPIFMPGEGFNWQIAKACFESADFIIHEIVSHLGYTHVVLEGPLVAVNRQLPKEHPIHDLLKPHLEGTAMINWGAQNLLIVEGGPVDNLQANDIKDSWTLVLAETVKRISKDFSPIADFEERQVTVKDFPGRYPYRDFGTQYWEAIYTWVKEYLDARLLIYYTNDKDIEEDYELKGFVEEMTGIAQMMWLNEFYTSNDKKGIITKARLSSAGQPEDVIASIIYSASVLHAAVNFPQSPTMSFVPSCPGSMFAPIPSEKKERTFKDYLAHLPPLEVAKEHVTVLTLLGSIFYTKLGDYEPTAFDDDRVRAPLAKFQAAIEEIDDNITNANAEIVAGWRKRGKNKKQAKNFGYYTLLPDSIPQSINI
ncbi:unnamed protein product [Ascophyllum nodosum]